MLSIQRGLLKLHVLEVGVGDRAVDAVAGVEIADGIGISALGQSLDIDGIAGRGAVVAHERLGREGEENAVIVVVAVADIAESELKGVQVAEQGDAVFVEAVADSVFVSQPGAVDSLGGVPPFVGDGAFD